MTQTMKLNAKWCLQRTGWLMALTAATALLLCASAPPLHAGQFSTGQVPQPQAISQGIDQAAAEVSAAEKALTEAKRRLAEGEAPLPGERTGVVGGNSRLNDAYFKRQEALKRAVEEAEKRLEQAYARRNAVRG